MNTPTWWALQRRDVRRRHECEKYGPNARDQFLLQTLGIVIEIICPQATVADRKDVHISFYTVLPYKCQCSDVR